MHLDKRVFHALVLHGGLNACSVVTLRNELTGQALISGQARQWRDYFVSGGTGAVGCLVQMLGVEQEGGSRPLAYAASRALAGLAAVPANAPEVVRVRPCVLPMPFGLLVVAETCWAPLRIVWLSLTVLPAEPVSSRAQELVVTLEQSSPPGKQSAALLLWELLCVPGSADTDAHMATLCAGGPDGLVRGLSWALHASRWGAAGIVQALTHESHK